MPANEDQIKFWNEKAGQDWTVLQERMDANLADIGDAVLALAAAKPGETVLDVGCGTGATSLALARAGAKVTGLDASAALIRVAQDHARASGLAIDYRSGELAELGGQFDLITCMEVIEHVADPEAFVDLLAKRLAPHGLLILSTPNATGWSKLLMIKIGEGIGRIPKGTHDFAKFIAPERMKVLLGEAGLRCVDVEGIAWSPTRGLHLSDDIRLNYLVAAVRA